MTERFINTPHLPKGRVTKLLISSECNAEIFDSLARLGVTAYKLPRNKSLPNPVVSHPDMNAFHCGGNRFIVSDALHEAMNGVFGDLCGSLSVTVEKTPNDSCDSLRNNSYENVLAYPQDAYLDCLLLKKHLFYGKSAGREVLSFAKREGLEAVAVKQGYVKCSVCPVSENAVITEDGSIAKVLSSFGIDVLLLQKKEIVLSGYDCGFIGGATFKLSEGELAFFGDVQMLSQRDEIKSFCAKYGVSCISLSKSNCVCNSSNNDYNNESSVCDYGGAICICERSE